MNILNRLLWVVVFFCCVNFMSGQNMLAEWNKIDFRPDAPLNNPQYSINQQDTGVNVKGRSLSADCSHIGLSYSFGVPLMFSPVMSQKDGLGQKIWSRQMTFAYQVGFYWGSRSLVNNGSLSLGVGIEYSRMRFAAGIGYLSDILDGAVDRDNDLYTAYLTYKNVEETATLHYLGIPLTLSIGQPYHDRISSYAQITLVPSFCLSSSFSVSGFYDHEGYYSAMDLTLSDFQSLGFGHNMSLGNKENLDVNRFLLTGRVAGGIYLPLCQTQKGKTSPWVVKLGVKLDFSITSMAKSLPEEASFPNATYRLNQYNLMSSDVCRFVNPGLEVGIMYIVGTKSSRIQGSK